ncbi:MAG: hypothetical protein KDC92_04045 [Bacteroidetes bacterium]|nr:hypothetical protein [Bacteroidota bacterium]
MFRKPVIALTNIFLVICFFSCVHEPIEIPEKPSFQFISSEIDIPDFNNRPCKALGINWMEKDSFIQEQHVFEFQFMNNGKYIVYVNKWQSNILFREDTIWLLDLTTGLREPLLAGHTMALFGTKGDILIANNVVSNTIWTINIKTKEVTELKTRADVLCVSPDGQRLCCSILGEPAINSYFLAIDVETEKMLWRGEYDSPVPYVWNNSSEFLLSYGGNSGKTNVFEVNLESNPEPQLIFENRPFFNNEVSGAYFNNDEVITQTGWLRQDFELVNLSNNSIKTLVEGCTSHTAEHITFNPLEDRYYFSMTRATKESGDIEDIIFYEQEWFTMAHDGTDVKQVDLDFRLNSYD